MKKPVLLLFASACLQMSFASIGNYDIYISYSSELRFRAGINYKNIGLYVRPVFSKEYYGDYLSSAYSPPSKWDTKGMELGINLNKQLFAYKKAEMIINFSCGNTTSYVTITDGSSFWTSVSNFAIIPEIRFFKKASVTLTPLFYQYYWPVKKIDRPAQSSVNYLSMSIMQLNVGLKFYY